MVELELCDASVDVGNVRLVHDVQLSLQSGELVAVVGENGAGKSTLLRAIAGYVPFATGDCRINEAPLSSLSARARARAIAWLPQSVPIAWPIRVYDAVALGRFPHGAAPWRMAEADRIAIENAMIDCDLNGLSDRSTSTLSGGELARVHIARALASTAPLLLADEPVASLDPRHQLAVMQIFRRMADKGGASLVVLHDLGLAARFADRIVGMKGGRVLIDSQPETVVTPHWIRQLFDVDASVSSEPGWPQPLFLPG